MTARIDPGSERNRRSRFDFRPFGSSLAALESTGLGSRTRSVSAKHCFCDVLCPAAALRLARSEPAAVTPREFGDRSPRSVRMPISAGSACSPFRRCRSSPPLQGSAGCRARVWPPAGRSITGVPPGPGRARSAATRPSAGRQPRRRSRATGHRERLPRDRSRRPVHRSWRGWRSAAPQAGRAEGEPRAGGTGGGARLGASPSCAVATLR